MLFHEKLSFLMSITKTTNSSLAKSICLDPSFISRLKNGKRTPSKNENYIKDMSYYLAKQCKTDSQKNILYKSLELPSSSYKYTLDDISTHIYNWFLDDSGENKGVEEFIENISSFKFTQNKHPNFIKGSLISKSDLTNGEVFYGIRGKRQAVISFLTEILNDTDIDTLLLYSDESMDWLIGDVNFTKQWGSLLSKVIAKGNKIIIIHTVNRNLNEMLAAIKGWLPIYMTGQIEPYYYPKARDSVFKKTIFIFSDKVGLISSSVDGSSNTSSNFIYTDSKIIQSFSDEFYKYLNKCRPLMKIFNSEKTYDYLSLLNEFESENGDTILKSDRLSVLSIPLTILRQILINIDANEVEKLYDYHKNRIISFKLSLKKNKFSEIITLPDIDDVATGNIKVPFSNILLNTDIYYNKSQIVSHLKNIIYLMENYDNYNVYIDSENKNPIYSLHVKDEVGVIIGKEVCPSIVFAINERDMTIAFWDYTDSIINKFKKKNYNKTDSIKLLNDLIEKIEKLPK